MTAQSPQGFLPPLRAPRGKPQSAEGIPRRSTTLVKATAARPSRGRRPWVWLLGLVAAVALTVVLVLHSNRAGQPPPPAPEPTPSFTVPQLALTPGHQPVDVLLPGRRLEAESDAKGCHLLAGRRAPLTEFHAVTTDDGGEIVTARAPLWCVDGTDFGLTVLLDCVPKRRCQLISLYSLTTRTYYQLPAESALLLHPDGLDFLFPSHIVLRRPARLRPYGGFHP